MASSCKQKLARFSTSLLESKTEPSVAKAQNYMERGHGKNVYWEGGHPTYFLDGGNSWGGEKTLTGWGHTAHTLLMVGTPHYIEKKYVRKPFRHLPDTFWHITYTF